MTERQIENRVKKLREIEEQTKELEKQAEELRQEIKADLEEKGLEELQTKNFMIRWKEIISNRFDSKALKESLPDVYERYTRQTSSRRFTVA